MLCNFGGMYRLSGDYAKAEPLLRQRSKSARSCWMKNSPTTE